MYLPSDFHLSLKWHGAKRAKRRTPFQTNSCFMTSLLHSFHNLTALIFLLTLIGQQFLWPQLGLRLLGMTVSHCQVFTTRIFPIHSVFLPPTRYSRSVFCTADALHFTKKNNSEQVCLSFCMIVCMHACRQAGREVGRYEGIYVCRYVMYVCMYACMYVCMYVM